MPKSPLESAIATWNKRHAAMAARGIPVSAYKELAHRDIERIKKSGGAAMPAPEARAAITAAVTEKPQLERERPTGVMGTLSNFAKDVGDIAWHAIPGLARFAAKQVTSEGEIPAFVKTLTDEKYREEIGFEYGGIDEILRNLSKAPITRIVPGTYVGGALANKEGVGEGLKELQQHPGIAALDVLSVAAPGGRAVTAAKIAPEGAKLAAAGQALASRTGAQAVARGTIGRQAVAAERAANKLQSTFNAAEEIKAAEAAGEVSAAKIRPRTGPKVVPTEAEVAAARNAAEGFKKEVGEFSHAQKALLEGNPVKAGFRAIGGTTETGMPRTSAAMRTVARKMNIDKQIRDVAGTGLQVEGRTMSREFNRRFDNDIKPMLDSIPEVESREFHAFITETSRGQQDDMIRLAEAEGDVAKAEMLSEWSAKGEVLRSFVKDISEQGEQQGFLKLVTGTDDAGKVISEVYSQDHPVVRAQDNMFRQQEKLGKVSAEVQEILANPEKSARSKAAAQAKLDKAKAATTAANKKFSKTLFGAKGVSARLEPAVKRQFREQAKERMKALDAEDPMAYQSMGLEQALKQVDTATEFAEMKSLMGPKLYNEVWKDTVGSWTKLIDEGYDPVYIPHVKSGTTYESVLHVRPIAAKETITPGMWKAQAFNFSPGETNVALGITKAVKDIIQKEGTEHYYQTYWDPIGQTAQSLKDDYVKRIENAAPELSGDEVAAKAQVLRDKDWKPLPEGYRRPVPLGGEVKLYPAHMVEAIEKLVEKNGKLPMNLEKLHSKAINTYRAAVLTSPRHLSHVGLGGSMMAMGYFPFEYWKRLPQARKIVKGDLQDTALNTQLFHPTPDQLVHVSGGKTLGRLFGSVGKRLEQWKKFEEYIANVQRVGVQLAGEAKGLERAEAIQLANRVLVSLDDMTPMERTILKQVSPFYAFSRHVMRYLMKYPVDNPYRATFLARLAKQEEEEQKTGLNSHFHMMFFLGQPDKDGNIKSVDFKSVNPFRTLDNDFTLAGFVSSLHPGVQWIGSASGIKMLSATPELHQELSIDENTGALVAKRKNFWLTGLETFIPQTETLDHFVTFTDRMRHLKEANPEAYESTLYSSLGIPFEGAIPGSVPVFGAKPKNLPYERAREERNRYKYAQQQVSKALQQGSTAPIEGFEQVPVPGGEMATPQSIEQILKGITAPEGVSKKAVMPRLR